MDLTVAVAPYTTTANNSKLLSLLKAPEIPTQLACSIPVYKDVDVSQIVESNTATLLSKKAQTNKSHQDAQGKIVEVGALKEEVLRKYVDISLLTPTTLFDQVATVVFVNFPNVKRTAVEKILDLLMVSERAFRWSLVNYDFIESKLLFVRFERAHDLAWFVQTYSSDTLKKLINDEIDLVAGEKALELDATSSPPQEDSQQAILIRQILDNPRNYERQHKTTGTEDLDQVLDFYSDYKIDKNELIDVPSHMRDAIVKDIVIFRSKVLTIERDNRKKEIEKERMQTKLRLKQIFEDIKETNGEIVDDSKDPIPEAKDEFDDMTEAEYEAYLEAKETEDNEKLYQQKLDEMKGMEADRRKLEESLVALENYENNLMDNKLVYIDDLKSVGETGDSLAKNNFRSIFSLYYSNYSQYLKTRSQKRAMEEASDARDRDEEARERDAEDKASAFLSTFKKPKLDKEPTPEPATDVPLTTVVVSELSSEKNSQLQQKIIELVEEYLGIKDDFLIDVIASNIASNNTDAKQELVVELAEVLDDDAENLVNDLWKFIGEL